MELAKITKRVRPDLLYDVVELEMEGERTSEFVTLTVPDYEARTARGMTDEEIFNEISWAHETPTMKELIDEHLTHDRLTRFAQGAVHAGRRYA